jgi:hypothetical protein
LAKDLKGKYAELSSNMMQLSTPEYFEKAKILIEKERDTADHFYRHDIAKETVIRYVTETLVVEKA